mgnify:CR=1 FL=1
MQGTKYMLYKGYNWQKLEHRNLNNLVKLILNIRDANLGGLGYHDPYWFLLLIMIETISHELVNGANSMYQNCLSIWEIKISNKKSWTKSQTKILFQVLVHSIYMESMNTSHSIDFFTNLYHLIFTMGKALPHPHKKISNPQFPISLWQRANTKKMSALKILHYGYLTCVNLFNKTRFSCFIIQLIQHCF